MDRRALGVSCQDLPLYDVLIYVFQMSSDKRAPDPELKKAFTELQTKMVDSKQKMRMADLQVRKR